MGAISFDPYKTQGISAGFNVDSTGFTQGDAQDDPAIRLQLASGIVGGTVALWGGMGVIENIPTVAARITGSILLPATATACNGFTVFNQAYHGLITPSSQVPQYPAGGSVHFYRIGSGARIPLQLSAAAAALANGATAMDAKKFVWDPVNFCVDVASTGGMALKLLMISTSGNLAAVQNTTTKDVNWDSTKSVGLFQI